MIRKRRILFNVIFYAVSVESFLSLKLSSSLTHSRPKHCDRYLPRVEASFSSDDDPVLSSLVREFVGIAQASASNDNLAGFTICGPSKKKAKDDRAIQKGALRMVTARKINIKKKGIKLQVTFKYHGATDIVQNWEPTDSAKIIESIIFDNVNNGKTIPNSEWGPVLSERLGSTRGLQRATFECTTGDVYELNISPPPSKLRHQKGTRMDSSSNSTIPRNVPQPHDRVKNTPVDPNHPMWHGLGVTDKIHGKPRPGMTSKLRQCQKFVEIVGKLVDTVSVETNRKSDISVIDMGCGRGYLTFALHWFLKNKYKNVNSRGIDIRPKLVEEISAIARQLGDDFSDLQFETGSIESFLAEIQSSDEASTKDTNSLFLPNMEILIALHACDTATDDALWAGIARNASIIVVAPCCHREVRPQLNQWLGIDNHNREEDHPYSDILRHNIYRERMAEMVTDSIRALLLELAGYTVQVFEFIGGEHTSKNVMITAVKKRKRLELSGTTSEKATAISSTESRLRNLAKLHGIHDQKLAQWMGIALSTRSTVNSNRRLTTKSMPKLHTKNY
jgi:SAM-dependent methyltransferase